MLSGEIILYGIMSAIWFADGQVIAATLACMVSVVEIIGMIVIVR